MDLIWSIVACGQCENTFVGLNWNKQIDCQCHWVPSRRVEFRIRLTFRTQAFGQKCCILIGIIVQTMPNGRLKWQSGKFCVIRKSLISNNHNRIVDKRQSQQRPQPQQSNICRMCQMTGEFSFSIRISRPISDKLTEITVEFVGENCLDDSSKVANFRECVVGRWFCTIVSLAHFESGENWK